MGDLPTKVEGGHIVRDTEGNPTGTFTITSTSLCFLRDNKGIFVDNAMKLIPIPDWTEDDTAKFFDTTMKDALSVGLTSIHDAGSPPEAIAFFKK